MSFLDVLTIVCCLVLQRKKLSKISPDPFNPTPTDDANDDDGDHTYQPNAQGNAMSVDRNDREREKVRAFRHVISVKTFLKVTSPHARRNKFSPISGLMQGGRPLWGGQIEGA